MALPWYASVETEKLLLQLVRQNQGLKALHACQQLIFGRVQCLLACNIAVAITPLPGAIDTARTQRDLRTKVPQTAQVVLF